MKRKIISCAMLLITFAFSANAQNKPKATYRVGPAKITVWENESEGEFGKFTWKNFRVEKLYKKEDQWESTHSFDLTELLQLRAAIDKAIAEEAVNVENAAEE